MSIYLIRHAESEFNAAFEEGAADPMIFDAPLSELGKAQAEQAKQAVQGLGICRVIVSPLTRTLQTATILFGERFPMDVHAGVREQVLNSCDVGSSPEALAKAFPHFDFGHLEACWWHNKAKDHRGISVEPDGTLQKRADEFIAFLKANRMSSTAIVSHDLFIRAMSGVHAENCGIVRFDL